MSWILAWVPFWNAAAAQYETGDLVFQESRSGQSLAIQQATGSRYSHMGMMVIRDGAAFVLEAAAKVRYQPLADWIAQGEGGHYVIKRLGAGLDLPAKQQLTIAAERFLGKSYDLSFVWSDDELYCSELVWKLYQRSLKIEIGALQRLHEFDLTSALVQTTLRERYGTDIPWDEPVISPAMMFASTLLMTVEEGGQ